MVLPLSTRVTTRQFSINMEHEKKLYHCTLNIEQKELEELSGKILSSSEEKDSRSSMEREYDVIRSIVEKAFTRELGKMRGKKFSIDVSKSTESKEPARAVVRGGDRPEGFFDVELKRTEMGATPWKALRIVETTNHKTLLERFNTERVKKQGIFGKIEQILDKFFQLLGKKFACIDRLWRGITGRHTLPWNIKDLVAVCDYGEGSEVKMEEALAYMGRAVKSTEPKLSNQLLQASRMSKRVRNRKKLPEEEKKFSKRLQELPPSSFSDEVLFLPYFYGTAEMLGKVTRTEKGYSLLIVNFTDDVKKELNLPEEIESLEVTDLEFTDIENITRQMIRGEKIELEKQKKKGKCLQKEGEKKEDTFSLLSEMVSRSIGNKDEYEYSQLGLKLRLFLDICKGTDKWLQDPDYHDLVERSCYALMDEAKQKISTSTIPKTLKDTDLGNIERELRKILNLTEEHHPQVPEITNYTLANLGGSSFPRIDEEPTQVGTLSPKELTADLSVQKGITRGTNGLLQDIKDKLQFVPTLPAEIEGEIKKELKYMPYPFTDATIVKDAERALYFPSISSEKFGLSREEQKALIYTLHSQKTNPPAEREFITIANQEEKKALAHYTLQAILDNPRIGRSETAQAWLMKQLFVEKRIDTLLADDQGKRILKEIGEEFKRMIPKMIEVPRKGAIDKEQYAGGLFLLRLVGEIDYYAKQKNIDLQLFNEKETNNYEMLVTTITRLAGQDDARSNEIKALVIPEFIGMIHDRIATGLLSKEQIPEPLLGHLLSAITYCRREGVASPFLASKVKQLEPFVFALAKERVEQSQFDGVRTYLNDIDSELAGENIQWQIKEFPILQALRHGQKIELDLLTGEVFSGGKRVGYLPQEVKNHEDLIRLYPKAGSLLWVIERSDDDPSLVVYSPPEDSTIRIITKDGAFQSIEKKFSNEKGEVWGVYHHFPAQDAVVEGKPVSGEEDDLPLKVAQAIRNRFCWVSKEENAVFITEGTGKYFGVFEQREGEDTRVILANQKTLLSPEESGLRRFTSFDRPENMLLYGEKGETSEVEFPLLRMNASGVPLSYTLKKEGNNVFAESPLFAGWKLAPFTKRPGLHKGDRIGSLLAPAIPPGFTTYQLLEKGNRQKILLLHRPLKRGKSVEGTRAKGTYRTKREDVADQNTVVFEYNLNPETNRLEASTAEGYLQLAYICFAHKEYSNALAYLEKAQSSTGDTKKFAQIFKWIQEWDDSSDLGKATQLRLLCFAERVRGEEKIREKQKVKTRKEGNKIEPVGKSPYKEKIQELSSSISNTDFPDPIALRQRDKETLEQLEIESVLGKESTVMEKQISQLEKKLGLPKDVSLTESLKVDTIPLQEKTIIGEAYFERIGSSYFKTEHRMYPKVETKFFDETKEKTKSKATKRLADEHKKDFEVAQNIVTVEATTTKKNAEELQKDLEKIHEKFVEEKENALRRSLTLLEGVGGAGAAVIDRAIGDEEYATIDSLVEIWRRGDLMDPTKGKKEIRKIAKRDIKEAELRDIDWIVTQYLAAVANLRHIERTQSAAKDYIASCQAKKEGDPRLAQDLYNLVSHKRHYALYTQMSDLQFTDVVSVMSKNDEIKKSIFQTMNRHFSIPEEAASVKNQIQDAINHKSDLSVLRILENNKLVEEIFKDIQADPQFIRDLCQQASDRDYRHLLSIEHACELTLRQAQVTILREMVSNPNVASQLGMGGGKSKVITPLLAKEKATGKNLVCIVHPRALSETNRRDLDNTNRRLFGQEMFHFDYNRFSALEAEDLREIRYKLLQTIDSKGFITATKSSLLSFRNSYISLIEEISTEDPLDLAKCAKAEEMAKILKIFKERMDVVSDEIHEVLNIKEEVNFAAGDRTRINQTKVQVGLACMTAILQSKPGEPLHILREALENNSQAKLSPKTREGLLESLAEALLQPDEKNKEMVNYLVGKREDKPQEMKNLKGDNRDRYNELACLRAFLRKGFQSTLKKECLVDYGRDLTPTPGNEPFTIPFKGSNSPSRGSEFEDDIERICFTFQDYAYKEVDQALVQDCVNTFLQEMDKEYKEKKKKQPGFRYAQTQAYMDFTAIIRAMDPKKELGLVDDLNFYGENSKTSKAVAKLANGINSSSQARVGFCAEYTMKHRMNVFPRQISSRADDLVDMCHSFSGFTGTPWSQHTFHDKIHTEINWGVDGHTYQILLHKSPKVKKIQYNPASPLQSFADLTDKGYKALIDTGAYLRGVENEDFIVQALDNAEEGSVGIYYDETGTLVGRKKGEKAVPLDQMEEGDLEKRITLYDQSHTVGTDVKQAKTAVAAVTIGGSTPIYELFQAVWRMRQIDQEQAVEFLISDAVESLIREKIGKPEGDLTTENILQFCLLNQAEIEAEVNYRAEVGKIGLKGPQRMFDEIVDIGQRLSQVDAQNKMKEIFPIFRERLTKNKKPVEEEFDEYASPTKGAKPNAVLDYIKKEEALNLENIAEKIPLSHASVKGDIQLVSTEIKNRQPMPENLAPEEVVQGGERAGGMQEAEAEAYVETAFESFTPEEEPPEPEPVEIQPSPGGGETQMTGNPILHEELRELETLDDAALQAKAIGGYPKYFQVSNMVPLLGKEFFVGGTYEGRMPRDALDENMPNEEKIQRERTLLHVERLPINEALFIKSHQGWRVIFGSTHDSYPSFSTFPAETRTPCSFVAVTAGKPVFLNKNVNFDKLDPEEKKEFLTLYTQLKFFKGEFEYSQDELAVLREWIGRFPSIPLVRSYYETQIKGTLSAQKQRMYTKSPLRNLFDIMT